MEGSLPIYPAEVAVDGGARLLYVIRNGPETFAGIVDFRPAGISFNNSGC